MFFFKIKIFCETFLSPSQQNACEINEHHQRNFSKYYIMVVQITANSPRDCQFFCSKYSTGVLSLGGAALEKFPVQGTSKFSMCQFHIFWYRELCFFSMATHMCHYFVTLHMCLSNSPYSTLWGSVGTFVT